jgi:hypothetical protein
VSSRFIYAIVGVLTVLACTPLLAGAFFCLDDYRYLQQLRHLGADPTAWLSATVVENRWDVHWWIPEGTLVRFFRPFMIASYALDARLWGLAPLGFTITNVALHLATTLLVTACFLRILGRGVGALVAGMAFGLQYSHFENLYYIPGRAELFATVAVALALWLFLRTRERGRRRDQVAVAAVCFLAFLGKESAALLPVLLLLYDVFVPGSGARPGLRAALRRNAVLLLGCGIVAAAYLVLRSAALAGGQPSLHTYPYIHPITREGFAARTGLVWLQYCAGLGTGAFIYTFLEWPRQLFDRLSIAELAVGVAWVHGLLVFGCCSRRGRWLAALFLLGIVPLLPLYSSARHLYTASIGYCGLVGLVIDRILLGGWRGRRGAAALLILAFVALPAVRLVITLSTEPRKLSNPDPAKVYAELFARGDAPLRSDRPLYLLDFPGDWYEMQFVGAAVEVVLDRDVPRLEFLAPTRLQNPQPIEVRTVDEHTIELSRGGRPVLPFAGRGGFDMLPLTPGTAVQRADFAVEILECEGARPTRIRVRFERPLAEIQLARFDRGDRWALRRVEP